MPADAGIQTGPASRVQLGLDSRFRENDNANC
jgi:hypothetical protein